ncbi:hypothetical protein NKG94_18330 [Micromonospora sp. M12]
MNVESGIATGTEVVQRLADSAGGDPGTSATRSRSRCPPVGRSSGSPTRRATRTGRCRAPTWPPRPT